MRFVVTLLVGLLLATAANALSLADISGRDASGGLKEALTQGAAKAVAVLGRPDGFLGNPKVRIPLPESVQKIEGVMRGLGMGKQADELLTAMNRAAEAAVPQAKLLLVNSKMRLASSSSIPAKLLNCSTVNLRSS